MLAAGGLLMLPVAFDALTVVVRGLAAWHACGDPEQVLEVIRALGPDD